MQKRTSLATATLTALMLSVGALQAAPIGAEADPASLTHPLATQTPSPAAEGPATPQWAYALELEDEAGFGWNIASIFICAGFGPWGGIACGITAAA